MAALALTAWHASESPAALRSAAERLAFVREKPCPAAGLRRCSCPGYVIDHVQPLCAGGPDRRENMQWQAAAEAKVKDQWERHVCTDRRKNGIFHRD